jgi:thiol:disulfide interchange protein DsbD
MRRFLLLAMLGVLVVAVVSAASASGRFTPSDQASGGYGKYLPPDKAFQLSASPRAHAVVLDWDIHDGYYLYRDKFEVKAKQGKLGQVQFPPGEMKNDPNFGRVEVYRRAVRAEVPVKKMPSSGQVALRVTYQGCAEGGICYPPITKHLTVQLTKKDAAAVSGGAMDDGGPGAGQSTQGHLASLVAHANPLWFVPVFFVLGVLLSFTPCVLPMVPILAGILGKSGGQGGSKRGFMLALAYVLAMTGVYTAAGVVAGLVGVGLQGFFQTPWIIGLFAAVFVALALSLFGVYELRPPAAVSHRLATVSGRTNGTSLFGAAGMGALAALIVSPCIAAPIAGALIAIGQAGVPVRGGIALAALALGMGAPLLVYGTVAGRLLPQAGAWMVVIRRLLGIAMLAYAVWLLGRVVPGPVTLVLWGVTGLVAAVVLGVFKRPVLVRRNGWARSAGLLAGLAGLVLIIGGAAGGSNPLAPFANWRPPPQAKAKALDYHVVGSVAALQTQLAQAAQSGRPVMVDFRADWCTACLEMEHTTFRQSAVRQALARLELVKVDVTANTAADRQLLKHFGLYGPPAYLFFSASGQPLRRQNVVGYLAASEFLPHVHAALAGGHSRG